MLHRSVTPILALAVVAACGPTRVRDEPPRPRIILCCHPPLTATIYRASSKAAVGAAICNGSDQLWAGAIAPGDKPLEVPVGQISGGKPVGLQFTVGTDQPRCLDDAALAKLPATRELVEVTLDGTNLVPCNRGEGCTCPVCPDPKG